MIRLLLMLFLFGSLYSNINQYLLDSMLDDYSWKFLDKKKEFFIYEKEYLDNKIYMVKKEVYIEKEKIFSVVSDLGNYSNVLTSKNVINDYLGVVNKKKYGYQQFTNFIPFIKNRQIIFEMSLNDDNIISWVLLDGSHPLFEKYNKDKVKTLSFGAGLWQYAEENNRSYIIHKFFIDPKLSVPKFIISNAAQNNVIQVVEDVLNYAKGEGN